MIIFICRILFEIRTFSVPPVFIETDDIYLSIPFVCDSGYLYFLPTHGGSNLGGGTGSGAKAKVANCWLLLQTSTAAIC